MKKPFLQASALVLTVALLPATTSAISAVDANTYREMEQFMSVFDRVRNDYVDQVDDADLISKKIKKARTDQDPIPGEAAGLEGRPEVQNLVSIYAALANTSEADVLKEFEGQGFGAFKPALVDVTVEHLAPITARYREILDDPALIDATLADGAERAREISEPIMEEVRRIVGFWRP